MAELSDIDERLDKFQRLMAAALVDCELTTGITTVVFKRNGNYKAMVLRTEAGSCTRIEKMLSELLTDRAIQAALEFGATFQEIDGEFVSVVKPRKPEP